MINHETNFYDALLPEAHQKLVIEARRELQNMVAPLSCKYNNPQITGVWEVVTSDQNEYTVILKDIYSNIPKLTDQLQIFLKSPLMGYMIRPQNFRLGQILKEKNEEKILNVQNIEDNSTGPY
ncbi:hypothetical protein H6A66_03960 [Bacteroides caecigallinarum]|uniref:hypothetical protein n=1 Tax=Bacteroides caecigallinarum TaxID=1411144 RepID=UPI001958C3E8|nr:hypothetical protein [Bacteroides caecigallinarum]MBM6864333.1 hypothetical protein [Bacteroides caecigallinarum]